MPNRHDNLTLINSIEHLFYEMQMFVELTFTETQYSIHVQNAILGSWLIHLRNVDDMRRSSGKADDIQISDYLPHAIPPLIGKDLRKRINKEVAHMTSVRKEYGPRKHWDRAAIYRDAWPGIEMMILLLETWLRNNDADSQWRRELAALRERGAQLLESAKPQSENSKHDLDGWPHNLQPMVTHTVGYLPSPKSTNNERIFR